MNFIIPDLAAVVNLSFKKGSVKFLEEQRRDRGLEAWKARMTNPFFGGMPSL